MWRGKLVPPLPRFHQPQKNERKMNRSIDNRSVITMTPDEQRRFHTGRLSLVNALKLIKRREGGEATLERAANGSPTHQKRLSSVKLAEWLYTTVEKLADMPEEEWAMWISPDVRRVIAFHLSVEFTTFKDMVKARKKGEQQTPAVGGEG